ncbi:DUF3667 domain-containing protein [Chryseobacterium sp. Tr-659]|uniref:DUF3667 domain-containing protein n=1 Tax=Chryseobacterium sp. Tr-659 TaxID=2608340 RepID=UPI001421DB7D|nr:DUF3667 domain-containing protein [Chryseobacterium sp. Tr-659]NIF07889.1 DUF3667 domain-containing protein [Chryseobacterium sp. Tr-659]
MSHGKIREDKTCLNCGHQVEERFCPHCGQENIEPRQPFHYLFTHFIEDFTHYDGQFWKTIKYLLFNPGKLTKEYLAGKRQLFVAPVKLYIFISFITFLVPSFLPESESASQEKEKTEKPEREKKHSQEVLKSLEAEGLLSKADIKKVSDSLKKKDTLTLNEDIIDKTFSTKNSSILNAHNLKQYDSLQAKDNSGIYQLLRPFVKKVFSLREEGYTKEQVWAKYKETFIHSIPKALFVYLPIFSFFLWVFHNKKKWWYFDHGIFTLHYFSFLLLSTLIFIIFTKLDDYVPDYTILNIISFLAFLSLFLYTSVYFFVAHHRVYESSKRMSILKGITLFIINSIGIVLMLLVLMYTSFIMMH